MYGRINSVNLTRLAAVTYIRGLSSFHHWLHLIPYFMSKNEINHSTSSSVKLSTHKTYPLSLLEPSPIKSTAKDSSLKVSSINWRGITLVPTLLGVASGYHKLPTTLRSRIVTVLKYHRPFLSSLGGVVTKSLKYSYCLNSHSLSVCVPLLIRQFFPISWSPRSPNSPPHKKDHCTLVNLISFILVLIFGLLMLIEVPNHSVDKNSWLWLACYP